MTTQDGKEERIFAVHTGNILKAVRAHDHGDAACQALRRFAHEQEHGVIQDWQLGAIIHVVEEGCSLDDSVYILTEQILKAARFEAVALVSEDAA